MKQLVQEGASAFSQITDLINRLIRMVGGQWLLKSSIGLVSPRDTHINMVALTHCTPFLSGTEFNIQPQGGTYCTSTIIQLSLFKTHFLSVNLVIPFSTPQQNVHMCYIGLLRGLAPCCLIELSVVMGMFFISVIQSSNQKPHMATKHLKCGQCE